MSEQRIKLFCLNNAAIQSELSQLAKNLGISAEQTDIERSADKLVEDYIPQFDHQTRIEAERMSEFYRLFYMLENDIRGLIQSTLESAVSTDWWKECVPEAVRKNAEANRRKELGEGIIPRSDKLIDYTTFGELSEIIKSNWDVFGGLFSAHDIAGIERVLRQLNMLRSPIAHCGVLSEEEVVSLKLTLRRWFKMME